MVVTASEDALHLLDTCVCIDLLRGKADAIRVAALFSNACAISSIAAAELWTGIEKIDSPKRRGELEVFLESLPVLEFPAAAARDYGRLRADLEKRGIPIGPLDTLIAAHALHLGATLVTANVREFKRIPKLKCLSW